MTLYLNILEKDGKRFAESELHTTREGAVEEIVNYVYGDVKYVETIWWHDDGRLNPVPVNLKDDVIAMKYPGPCHKDFQEFHNKREGL